MGPPGRRCDRSSPPTAWSPRPRRPRRASRLNGIGIAAGDAAAGVDDRRFARVRRARKTPAQAAGLEQPLGLGARPDAREGRRAPRRAPAGGGRIAARLDGRRANPSCDSFMTDSAHLSSGVLAAVLGAAALHALWNSLVKSASDKFLSSAIVALWCGVAALVAALRSAAAGGARPFRSSSPRRSSISSISCWSDSSIATPTSRSPIRSCAGSRR